MNIDHNIRNDDAIPKESDETRRPQRVSSQRSASIAAMQPLPAAVIA